MPWAELAAARAATHRPTSPTHLLGATRPRARGKRPCRLAADSEAAAAALRCLPPAKSPTPPSLAI